MTILAHGVGTRADLPLPLLYVVVGGGVAVVASFVALGVLWREPRLTGGGAGRPVADGFAAFVDGRPLRVALKAVALALSLLVLVVAFFGPAEIPANVAPWAFFVTFWVGLVPLSIVFGPVWGVVNPLRTLYAGLRRVVGEPRGAADLERLGYWPAAASLLAFAWVELALPHRSEPDRVGTFLALYAVVHLAAAVRYGDGWFARGDGFEAYSRLLGRMSVLGRRSDGRLVWRNPLDGVTGLPEAPGLVAVVVVLVGSTAFDGLTRTLLWQDGPGSAGEAAVVPPTIGLAVTICLVGALYVGGARLCGIVGRYPGGPLTYAHSLVPIAAGYAIAHYFSLLLFDGQTTYILLSDPFGSGLNLLGLSGHGVTYTLVSARTISLVQVGAIVAGHILGVVLAHDRAVRLAKDEPDSGHPLGSQVPMLTVMVLLTLTGLGLLLGA